MLTIALTVVACYVYMRLVSHVLDSLGISSILERIGK